MATNGSGKTNILGGRGDTMYTSQYADFSRLWTRSRYSSQCQLHKAGLLRVQLRTTQRFAPQGPLLHPSMRRILHNLRQLQIRSEATHTSRSGWSNARGTCAVHPASRSRSSRLPLGNLSDSLFGRFNHGAESGPVTKATRQGIFDRSSLYIVYSIVTV